MKKLLYAVAAIVVSLSTVSCSEETKSTSVEPMNIEFWEVCDADMIYELYNFFYNGEADACVLTALAESEEVEVVKEENLRPFSSLLVAEYPFKDRKGKTQTCCVGGYVGDYVFAAASKKNMAKINEYLALEEVQARLNYITNGEVLIAWSYKNTMENSRGGVYLLYALQGNGGLFPAMDGSGIVSAKAVKGKWGGFEVSITMNDRAAEEWADLTEMNIGKPLAIVMDNVVYSAPNVRGRIEGGKSSITGNFTLTEALALAKLINAN